MTKSLLQNCVESVFTRKTDIAMFILLQKHKLNHISHINKKFECPICFERKHRSLETAIVPCNHKFCNDCIQHWIENSKRDSECPVCRSKIYDVVFQGQTIRVQKLSENSEEMSDIDEISNNDAEIDE